MSATSGEASVADHALVGLAVQHHDDDDEEREQDQKRDRGHALHDEGARALLGGAEAADLGKRRADRLHLSAYPMIQTTKVSTIEPTIVAQPSRLAVGTSRPEPVSQIRWRMPPSM